MMGGKERMTRNRVWPIGSPLSQDNLRPGSGSRTPRILSRYAPGKPCHPVYGSPLSDILYFRPVCQTLSKPFDTFLSSKLHCQKLLATPCTFGYPPAIHNCPSVTTQKTACTGCIVQCISLL